MGKKRTFKIDNDIVDIPVEEVDVFLKEVPSAKEVQSFLIDKDTVDIPLEEVEVFKREVPDAKPLFTEDSDTTDVPVTPPIATGRDEVDDKDLPSVTLDEEGDVSPVVKIDKKDRDKFIDVVSKLPDNVLNDKSAVNLFISHYAKMKGVSLGTAKSMYKNAEALNVVYKELQSRYESNPDDTDNLMKLGEVLNAMGKHDLAYEAYDALEGKLYKKGLQEYSDPNNPNRRPDYVQQRQLPAVAGMAHTEYLRGNIPNSQRLQKIAEQYGYKGQELPSVGEGSYVQPTSSTPSTYGFSGRRGDDTLPTKESEYLNTIAEGIGQSSLVKPMAEMAGHGLEKVAKSADTRASIADKTLNLVTGAVETAMGVAGLTTGAGAVFGLPLMQVQNSVPTEVAEWMMPLSKKLAQYYEEKGEPAPEWLSNTAVLGDFALMGLLGGLAHGTAKSVGKNIRGRSAAKAINEMVDSMPVEEIANNLQHIEGRIQELGGIEPYVAERTKVIPEVVKRLEEIKEDAQLEVDAQTEVEPYEPKPQPGSLAEVKDGTSVMMEGKEGVIERGDDGTWYFLDDEGKSTQIKVEDKYNPTEPLTELGIQVMPEVSPEQIARAMADAEQVGNTTYRDREYFVSIDRVGNENPNGDFVLRRMPDGTLKDVFGSHPHQKFAKERKLAIINQYLKENGLPPRKKLTEVGKKAAEHVVEKTVEPVVEKPIEPTRNDIPADLEENGIPVMSKLEAEKMQGDGYRIFGFDEMTEAPVELFGKKEIDNFSEDQLLAYKEPAKPEATQEGVKPKEDGKINKERGQEGRQDVLTEPTTKEPVSSKVEALKDVERTAKKIEDSVNELDSENDFVDVYHGGDIVDVKSINKNSPLYVTEQELEAISYLEGNGGHLTKVKLDRLKIADEELLRDILEEMGYSRDEYMIHELIDPRFEDSFIGKRKLKKAFDEIEKKGFEAVRFQDSEISGKQKNIDNIVIVNAAKTLKNKKFEVFHVVGQYEGTKLFEDGYKPVVNGKVLSKINLEEFDALFTKSETIKMVKDTPPVEAERVTATEDAVTPEVVKEAPKQKEEFTRNTILSDVDKYNSLPKKERQIVGANLFSKIKKQGKQLGWDVSYNDKGDVIMLNKKGKRQKKSPVKMTEDEKQIKLERQKNWREAMGATPVDIRHGVLQYMLRGGSFNPKALDKYVGFKNPSEYPAFIRSEKGIAMDDFYTLLKEDMPELERMDDHEFGSIVGDVIAEFGDRSSMHEAILEYAGEGSEWRNSGLGFSSKEEYLRDLEGRMEAAREREELQAKVDEQDYVSAMEMAESLTDAEVDQMMKDLDNNFPKTEEEINTFYEENGFPEDVVDREVGDTPSIKEAGEDLEAIRKDLEKREREKSIAQAKDDVLQAKKELEIERKRVDEILKEDQQGDIFGNREASPLDVRPEQKAREKALKQAQDKYDDAVKKLKKISPKEVDEIVPELPKEEKPVVDVDEQSVIGSSATFEHAGQPKRGEITEITDTGYIIEDGSGRKYPVKKEKATIIERRSVEELLQERRNLTNIALVGGVNIKMPSDLWGKLKKWSNRNLTITEGLPKDVFNYKVAMEGGKTAAMTQIKYTVQSLKDAIKKDYDKTLKQLNAKDVVSMNKYLAGDTSVQLPTNVKGALNEMRIQVDKLSTDLIDMGIAEGELALTIEQNEGMYLTRTYRLHDDPAWSEIVPESIRNEAKAFLRNEYPNATTSQIDGLINKLLYSEDAPIAVLSGSKLGAKDLGIFKKRKNIPVEIRRLMGEYEDPIVNYAKSVYKMSALIEQSKFLKSAYDAGIGKYFFENPEGQYAVQIASKTNKAYNPLNGLYTTPELAEIMSNVKNLTATSEWYRYYMTLSSAVKTGKTIGSVATHIRNVLSNMFFVFNNGHLLKISGAKDAMAVIKAEWNNRATPERIEYIKDLQRRGVLDDGANAGELRNMIEDATKRYDEVQDFLKDDVLNRVKKGAIKSYQLEDAMYKVYAFEAEKQRYMDAGFSANEAMDIAATNVRNTYPTYSLVPRAIKAFRQIPLGDFVSFPSEVIRTYGNTWALSAREIRNPATRQIGITRMSFLITGSILVKAISEASKYNWNVTNEEEKALRKMQPPWSKNSDYVYTGRDSKGVPVYLDLGYSDPYNYLKNPINAVLYSDDKLKGLTEGMYDFVKPFIGTEMLAQKILEINANKKKNGGTVYNEQLPLGDQAAQVWEHLNDVAYPGTITSLQRIYKGYKGEVSPTGKKYDAESEIAATLTGQRVNKTNVETAISFKAYEFKKNMQEASQIQTKAFYQKLPIDEQQYMLEQTNIARERVYNEFLGDYMAARKLGMTEDQLDRVLKSNGISEVMRKQIHAQTPIGSTDRGFEDILNSGSPIVRARNFADLWSQMDADQRKQLIKNASKEDGVFTKSFWDELKSIDIKTYKEAKEVKRKNN